MKKRFLTAILTILAVLMGIFGFSACNKVDIKVSFVVDSAVYATVSTKGNETITMPDDPEKAGYVFDGWYWDKGTWKKPFTANSLLNAPLSKSMSVYARFISEEAAKGTQAYFEIFEETGRNEYSLKVSNSMSTLAIEPLVSVSAESTWVLTLDLYANQTIASKTASLEVGDNTYYVLVTAENGATRLYTLKIRRKQLYTVSFNTQGGTPVEDQLVEEDAYALAPQTSRDGYDFVAWDFDFSQPITRNVTVSASWTARQFTIAYNLNGGQNHADNPTSYSAETFEFALQNPTRTGFDFGGWYTDSAFAPETRVEKVSGATATDLVLYAQWSGKCVNVILADSVADELARNVRFDLNGADGVAPETQYVTDSLALRYPAIPSRDGYLFAGWYSAPECVGEPYDFATNVTSSMTLYAKWVSVSANGVIPLDGSAYQLYIASNTYSYYAFLPLVSGSVVYNTIQYNTGYEVELCDANQNTLGLLSNALSGTVSVSAGNLYFIRYRTSSSRYITITLRANSLLPNDGGIASGLNINTVQIGYNETFTLVVPQKTGFTFDGWFDGVDGTGTQYTDATGLGLKAWDKETDTTLYAKWIASQSVVTFDKQDGLGGTDTLTVTYGSAMPTATAPTKLGHTFMGYYNAITDGVQYYDADMASVRDFDSLEDMTLYARWTPSTYTVTLEKQGGEGADSATAVYGQSLPSVAKPTRAGYTFGGYYDAVTDGTQYYDENMSTSIVWERTEDITLYARWTANTYTVSFHTNQGSGAQTAVTATFGEQMPEITIAPTREGYIFLGYFDALTSGTKYYNADLTSANNWANPSNTTLYARWQGVPYYVSFDANGGTGEMESQEFEYSVAEYLTVNEFLRTGYNFTGWNTESDGSGMAYADGANVLNLTGVSGGTVTLYAQWTAKNVVVTLNDLLSAHPSFEVSFDLNGASGVSPRTQWVTESEGLVYPSIPTRSGYLFGGWYTTSDCSGNPYDFTANVTENITLYAKWVSHSGYGYLYVGGNTGSITFPQRGSYRYYAFVPLVSGNVTVYSNNSTADTYGYLFNASKTQIAYNDDAGDGNNFSMTYSVVAGQLYYVAPCAYSSSSSCTGTVYISGASTPTAGGVAGGISIATATLTYNQEFTLSIPERTGYTFGGWYDGENGTGTQYTDATGASLRVWDKDYSTTLYARWTAVQAVVTLDKQNGTGGTDSATATYGSEMPMATAPTRIGFTFMGYYTAITGGVQYYNADMTSARDFDLLNDITLYARWSASTYTITFDKQGGNGTDSATAVYGSTLPIVAKPTRTGYTFDGYYDAVTDGTQYYDENMLSSIVWERLEGITLYAHWTVMQYTVSFNANQGVGTQESVTATYDAEMPEITVAPTRDGYIFVGYFDAVTGGTKYYNADLTSANNWVNASNTTLYAHWQGVPYYVEFNANLGTGEMATQEFEYGVAEYLNTNAFLRTGYNFVGWNTESDGSGTAYSGGTNVSNLTNVSGRTIVFYAQWTAKNVVVTCDDIAETRQNLTVRFNYNYSGASSTTMYLMNGQTLTSPTTPTRNSYIFTGWYTTSDCSTKYTFGGTITQDLTLYAGWVSRSATVSISNNSSSPWSVSGSSLTSTNKSHNSSSTYTITARMPIIVSFNYQVSSENNYDWLTIKKGSEQIARVSGSQSSTASVTLNTNEYLTFTYSKDGSVDNGNNCAYITNLTYSSNVSRGSITASCSASEDYVYAEGESFSKNVAFDSEFTLPAPTREGYTFGGWYDGENGTGTQYTDETGTGVRAWDKDVASTLYAKWTPITYEITYDTDGGVNFATNPVSYNIETETFTFGYPTKAGYTFVGWTSATVTTPVKDFEVRQGSMGALSLTAHWIEYDLNAITYNTSINKIAISQTLIADYFGAECIDTDGNAVTVTASFINTPVVGETVSVLLVATNGGKTVETTIEGVQVYGAPAVNVGTTTIKASDSITATTFNALATDSFDQALSVMVELVEGDTTRGGYRTYSFTAQDCVGNITRVNVQVMVYSADDIQIVVNEVAGIRVGSAGEEFGAVATDTFANACQLSVEVLSGAIDEAGSVVNLCLTATDVMGNTATRTIENVKVYGMPVATRLVEEIRVNTPAENLYVVRDSFGEVLDATITYLNTPVAGATVTVRVLATDVIGHQLNEEYSFRVLCMTDAHSVGANCTCEICGATVHTQGNNCTCLICGQTFHHLNASCVCATCGNAFHNYNAEDVCTACGNSMYVADVWNGTVASAFAGGNGSYSTPYLIETGAQLAYLANLVNNGRTFSGSYFRLENNINLNSRAWTPIGYNESYTFSGYFDGNNHVISNLNVTGGYKCAGLFGYASNARVNNLGVTDVTISNTWNNTGYTATGALVGKGVNLTVSYCYAQGSVTDVNNSSDGSSEVGGLIGALDGGSVSNCYVNATVYGSTAGYNTYCGGLIGVVGSGGSSTTINNCYAVVNVTGRNTVSGNYTAVGGLLGDMWSSVTIQRSFAVSQLSAIGSITYKGGLLGYKKQSSLSYSYCHYNTSASGSLTSYAGSSTSVSNLQSQSWLQSSLGWNFNDQWTFDGTQNYPVLKAFN